MKNENLSEKVSVNINSSTLSQIDLLVDNGYYSNRSDFINHALRTGLRQHQDTLERIIARNSDEDSGIWFAGVYSLKASDVERMFDKGRKAPIVGYGVLIIEDEVNEAKLFDVVKSISVKGKVACKSKIKAHYGCK